MTLRTAIVLFSCRVAQYHSLTTLGRNTPSNFGSRTTPPTRYRCSGRSCDRAIVVIEPPVTPGPAFDQFWVYGCKADMARAPSMVEFSLRTPIAIIAFILTKAYFDGTRIWFANFGVRPWEMSLPPVLALREFCLWSNIIGP